MSKTWATGCRSDIYCGRWSNESPIDAIRAGHPATHGLTRPNKWLFYRPEKMKRAWRVDLQTAECCRKTRSETMRSEIMRMVKERGSLRREHGGDTPTSSQHELRGVTRQSSPWGNDSRSWKLAWDNGTQLVPMQRPISSRSFKTATIIRSTRSKTIKYPLSHTWSTTRWSQRNERKKSEN